MPDGIGFAFFWSIDSLGYDDRHEVTWARGSGPAGEAREIQSYAFT